ncbi:FAD binding domain-containing protein [Spirochaeta cellobiosiphila]|uniref:FAD binding domain-containing protein n=1 Tax=Spirochaeta cellobiosiphila TaxID=504483 RepID=UPI000421761C|nr:FAD binding domain-containing protein [Spirochaeta cellobiosiphila]
MEGTRIRIHTPKTLGELGQLYQKKPKAILYAGGTYLLSHYNEINPFTGDIISLERIDEMRRLNRTERYFEIGATVPIPFILNTGSSYLPKCLVNCLQQIGPIAIQSQATLGGNLCVKTMHCDSLAVLLALGARLELRKGRQSRWIHLSQLIDSEGQLDFKEGEFLVRIRFPLEEWDKQSFIKLGQPYQLERREYVLCNLIKVDKNVIMDIRLALTQGTHKSIRIRNLEAQLKGKKVPLGTKDIKILEQETAIALDFPTNTSSGDLRRIHQIYKNLFRQLQD